MVTKGVIFVNELLPQLTGDKALFAICNSVTVAQMVSVISLTPETADPFYT